MTSSERPGRRTYSRRFFWLAVFIVIVIGGYSAAWFFVASKLESLTGSALTRASRDGRTVECTNPEARGFPFRLGLFCDGISFSDSKQGIAASAASFRSAAQIYNPFHVVAELDGPAKVSAPQLGDIGLNWRNLRSSIVFSLDFPDRISNEVDDLAVDGRIGTLAAGHLLDADHGESHMRRNGDDVDLAGSFSGARIATALTKGLQLPPLAGQADLTIANGVDLLRSRDRSLRGRSGTIRTLELSTADDTGIALAGPFSVGPDGFVDADLTVTVRKPKALAEQLAQIFPEKADQIKMSFTSLAALGDNFSMPLKVARGKATLGFIPLGEMPPL